jgi:hypothetical protein
VNILPYQEIYESGSQVDYYLGEKDVREKWPSEIVGDE